VRILIQISRSSVLCRIIGEQCPRDAKDVESISCERAVPMDFLPRLLDISLIFTSAQFTKSLLRQGAFHKLEYSTDMTGRNGRSLAFISRIKDRV
jgi:hypothetical protein